MRERKQPRQFFFMDKERWGGFWRKAGVRIRGHLEALTPPRSPKNPDCSMAQTELIGQPGPGVGGLVSALRRLPVMDKETMSGRCIAQTKDMEGFMRSQVGMRTLPGKFFVPGVRAFDLKVSLRSLPPSRQLEFQTSRGDSAKFKMSIEEVLQWQDSYQVFYAADIYRGEEGKQALQRSLEGLSTAGVEAWMMKFAVRVSENPVLMRFDGRCLEREVGRGPPGKIHLVSVCGIDFAGRVHDCGDIMRYIKNWREVYRLDDEGRPIVLRGRDFAPTGQRGILDTQRCLRDLVRMARLRLRAQDDLGIQVVVETGLGLGVFAGDAVGVGEEVRRLSAKAVRHVLEEEQFNNIKLFVLTLPIFRSSNNYRHFMSVFESSEQPYSGATPVLIADQDMHAVALAAAEAGYSVGQLNPADSHGVFGEYWQNFGPGTEEKVALTTCGLLTQHHVVNPNVLDPSRYVAVDLSSSPPAEVASKDPT